MNEQLNKFVRAVRQLEKELDNAPINQEIAQRMEVTVKRVETLRGVSRGPLSLETPVGRDGNGTLGDLLEDRRLSSPTSRSWLPSWGLKPPRYWQVFAQGGESHPHAVWDRF